MAKITDSTNKSENLKIEKLRSEKSIPKRVVPADGTSRFICKYHDCRGNGDISKMGQDAWEMASFSSHCHDGSENRAMTHAQVLWTEKSLLFSVEVEENELDAVHNDNEELWEGDNIEFLIAPRWVEEPLHDEYEFWFNSDKCAGGVRWHKGVMLEDLPKWKDQGLKWHFSVGMLSQKQKKGWSFRCQIPFEIFGKKRPVAGDHWGLGLYRKKRIKGCEPEFLAWSPTLTNPAKFHVPAKFGMLVFEE